MRFTGLPPLSRPNADRNCSGTVALEHENRAPTASRPGRDRAPEGGAEFAGLMGEDRREVNAERRRPDAGEARRHPDPNILSNGVWAMETIIMAARILQLGLGGWGLDWAATVPPLVERVEMVGYVDRSAEARGKARARLGLREGLFFASLEAALASVKPDGLLVVVPTAQHAAATEAGLAAGLDVLVEKPFTATLAEAHRVTALARRHGLTLMVSQNYRYHGVVMEAAAILRARRYGRPLSATIEFRQDWKASGHRYHDIPGPLLLDMGIHHFDMLRMIFGREVQRVACRSWNTPYSPFKDHAAAHALLDLEGGIVASYHGSWLRRGVATTWTGDWAIDCEMGELLFCARPGAVAPPEAGRLFLRRLDGRLEELAVPELPATDRAGTLDAFARAIETGDPGPDAPLAAETIGSLATSFACMRSAREDGRWVEVKGE